MRKSIINKIKKVEDYTHRDCHFYYAFCVYSWNKDLCCEEYENTMKDIVNQFDEYLNCDNNIEKDNITNNIKDSIVELDKEKSNFLSNLQDSITTYLYYCEDWEFNDSEYDYMTDDEKDAAYEDRVENVDTPYMIELVSEEINLEYNVFVKFINDILNDRYLSPEKIVYPEYAF